MDLPSLIRVRRRLETPFVEDVEGSLARSLAALELDQAHYRGARLALTAGSRGIRDIAAVLRVTGQFLKGFGAEPFIVPAMGSHGGATAEGQVRVLRELGITEGAVGLPIRASMETVLIGRSEEGVPLYMDKMAWESDGVILVNRIKPHTGFDGPIESGLMKMAVIGLGNHDGASSAHQAVLAAGYNRVIARLANLFLQTGKIRFGVAILENARNQTAVVEAIPSGAIYEREKVLQERSKQMMARLPFDHAHILIVDCMGKGISGVGMDPNVIGRRLFISEPEPERPRIGRIIVRKLLGDGNALGIGLADFTLRSLVEKVDWPYTYINAVTSSTPEKARLPMICDSERQALEWAMATGCGCPPQDARLAWIRSTHDLDEIIVSRSLLGDVLAEPGAVAEGPVGWDFDDSGSLPFLL